MIFKMMIDIKKIETAIDLALLNADKTMIENWVLYKKNSIISEIENESQCFRAIDNLLVDIYSKIHNIYFEFDETKIKNFECFLNILADVIQYQKNNISEYEDLSNKIKLNIFLDNSQS
jgi:hypothetical protein